MQSQSTKVKLVEQMLSRLEEELETLLKSSQAAAEAATHSENKPENKYDTRSLEASYLAGAQKERSLELRAAIRILKETPLKCFTEEDSIGPTALVEIDDGRQASFCFIINAGPGMRLSHEDKEVVSITPQSPLGKALLGKRIGELVTVATGQGKKDYEIISLF